MVPQRSNAPESPLQETAPSPEQVNKAQDLTSEEIMVAVTFMLGDQTYGADILQIQEVTGIGHITRVPHVKPYVRGVTNLRGNIVPTLDLRARLGLPKGDDLKGQQIIIARTDWDLVGYVVDTVREVITVSKSSIEPAPEGWMDADHRCFAGIARLNENLVTLIDFNMVIQADRVLLEEIRPG